MLRYVDDTSASVWVEVADLRPGQSTSYTVSVDGIPVWPLPGSNTPPSRIRTIADDGDHPARSCWYANAIATRDIDGRRAGLRWETAGPDGGGSGAMRCLRSARVT